MDRLDDIGARWSQRGRDEEEADWVIGVRFDTRRMRREVLEDSLADRWDEELKTLTDEECDEACEAMVDSYRAARRERARTPEALTTPTEVPDSATLGWIRLEHGRAGARAAIKHALQVCQGNKSAAARRLRTDPKTLRRALAELDRHYR